MAFFEQNMQIIKGIYFPCLGTTFSTFLTFDWYLFNGLNTMVMDLQEHGFVKHFESISSRITKKVQSNTENRNILVAVAGGIQEILIAF